MLFTCLNIRAIHIEVIESLNTSSFINALRRLLAIRGPVKQIRSDRGADFVGASKDLQIPSNVDEKVVKQFLSNHSCIWKFNPPHLSHMGKDDWACPQDLEFYASSDDILQTHAQSSHHLYGQSHCHYKQQTIDCCVNRSSRSFHPNTCHITYPKDRCQFSSTWGFWKS